MSEPQPEPQPDRRPMLVLSLTTSTKSYTSREELAKTACRAALVLTAHRWLYQNDADHVWKMAPKQPGEIAAYACGKQRLTIARA